MYNAFVSAKADGVPEVSPVVDKEPRKKKRTHQSKPMCTFLNPFHITVTDFAVVIINSYDREYEREGSANAEYLKEGEF